MKMTTYESAHNLGSEVWSVLKICQLCFVILIFLNNNRTEKVILWKLLVYF